MTEPGQSVGSVSRRSELRPQLPSVLAPSGAAPYSN